MKKCGAAAIGCVIAFAVIVFLRPLAVYDVATHLFLLARGFDSDYVRLGGNRVHSMIGGDGPPLLLVHGIGSKGEDYALIMPRLAEHHRLYVPDLLGFGRSDRPDIGYSIAAQAEMLRAYLDAKKIDKADVMAVSMGGWIALKFAAEHPERVRRLVLIDSAGFQYATAMNENSFTPRDRDELHHLLWLQTDRLSSLPWFIERDLLRKNHEHAWILRRAMKSMLSGRDLMDGRVQRVTMPVLLVWGMNDRIVPLPIGEKMRAALPDARLVAYSGCGHLAVIECRNRVLPEVERFLGGH
jgi:pimeloyl-ACP methyl ester carboxylesterase